jgi:hypothetical protein
VRWPLGLIGALALGACFDPRFGDALACDPAVGCPPGLLCDPLRGICVRELGDVDAAAPGDASLADATLTDAGPRSWTETTPLPEARNLHAAVAWDGRLYVLGGTMGGAIDEVLWAPILPGGELGAWQTTKPLPAPTRWHAAAVHDGRIYVLGGWVGSGSTDRVFMAQATSTGVDGWTDVTPLPEGRRGFSAFAAKDALYAVGGEVADGFVLRDTVFRAAIAPDGTLGSWTAEPALGTANYVFGLAVTEAEVFVTGGHGDPGHYQGASLASGTIAAWSVARGLAQPRQRHASFTHAGRLYVAGGSPSQDVAPLASVESAPILDPGELGPFEPEPPLPAARRYPAAVVHEGFVYIIGGSTGSARAAEAWFLPL